MSQLPKVGQNLRRLRNGLGLSLDEASKLTGVSKAMLGQIERGESSPTISTLWKISSGLKVNSVTTSKGTASHKGNAVTVNVGD